MWARNTGASRMFSALSLMALAYKVRPRTFGGRAYTLEWKLAGKQELVTLPKASFGFPQLLF